MRIYKDCKELQQGNCIVVCKNKFNGTIKEFEGSFNSKFKVVFFAITDRYEVVEYRQ